jgi:phosphoglycerate dehydrogenase-like enzyme
MKPVVALLDVMPEPSQQALAAAFAEFDLRLAQPGQDLHTLVADAAVLLSMWGTVDADLLAAAPKCQLLHKLGVGTDKFDLDAARQHGVTVLKAAGINADAVAELTVLLTLAVSRRLLFAVSETRAGRFQKEALRASTFQLVGKTVGLLGLGAIGRAVATRFRAFGAQVVYYDPRRLSTAEEAELGVEYRDMDDLLAAADVLSLHLPNTPRTAGMVNDALLEKVKPGVIVVNTARGALVDEAALTRAIEDGRVRGAGLDVTSVEPLPTDSPLHGLEEVVVTPHMGGAVADNFPRVAARAHANTVAVLAGRRPAAEADVVVWTQQ